MRIVLVLAVGLAACAPLGDRGFLGLCPSGESCSPNTPHGLEFVGTPVDSSLFPGAGGPAATAVGGTQDIELLWDPAGDGTYESLTLPYLAVIDDGTGGGLAIDDFGGDTVTVRGTLAGESYLRILDPATNELYDRYLLETDDLASVAIVPSELEPRLSDTTPIAVPAGSASLVVALTGATTSPLVDTSMTLSQAGARQTAWDTLAVPDAATGPASIAVVAAGAPRPALAYAVVDGADAIQIVGPPPTVPAAGETDVCFAATADGAQVFGLAWSFASDDLTVANSFAPSCATLVDDHGAATGHVTASAGGATLTTAVTIAGDGSGTARPAPRARPASWRRPDGERALHSVR